MVSNPKAKGWITKHPNRGSGQPEIELRADGWERFRRAVAAAAKSGPKHRSGAEKKTSPHLASKSSRANHGDMTMSKSQWFIFFLVNQMLPFSEWPRTYAELQRLGLISEGATTHHERHQDAAV
jgi:hypothetical protein